MKPEAIPDLDHLPVTVAQLDAEPTPVWDEMAPHWTRVQAVMALETAA